MIVIVKEMRAKDWSCVPGARAMVGVTPCMAWNARVKDHAVGESLLSTNISGEEWQAMLSDPEWIDIAEKYAQAHIYGKDVRLTVRVNKNTNNEPFVPFDKDDKAPAFQAVYIEVAVIAKDGSGIMIDVNPDTKQVNGYSEWDDMSRFVE